MRSDPEGVLEGALRGHAMGDLQAAAAYFADDVIFAICIEKDVLSFGGQVSGRSAMVETWRKIASAFALVRFESRSLIATEEIARCQVDFSFFHKTSGRLFEGVMRIVAEANEGKIIHYCEYHEQDRIRAFMRLVEGNANEDTA